MQTDSATTQPLCAVRPAHIIWDWNGTLQDDVAAAVNGMNHILRRRNLPLVDLATHRALFTFPVREYYDALGVALEHEDWEALSREFSGVFVADASPALFPDTVTTLTALQARGVPMSILSACEQTLLTETLRKHDIAHLFEHVYGLDNLGAGSKANRAAELFARIDAEGHDVWLIGDTTHDHDVAAEIGCNCVLLANGYQSRERLEQCGCRVLADVAEVPAFFGL